MSEQDCEDYGGVIAPSPQPTGSHTGEGLHCFRIFAGRKLSVLVHEGRHELLHRTERRAETTGTIREAVAFVVCQAAGLETNQISVHYLWNGKKETLRTHRTSSRTQLSHILSMISLPLNNFKGVQPSFRRIFPGCSPTSKPPS